jgi:hypothetical protein
VTGSHARAQGKSWHLANLTAAQTKCGGRIMSCACTIRLNAMAAVTTASTRRFVNVIGLVIPGPPRQLGCSEGGLMVKLDDATIASIVASKGRGRKNCSGRPPGLS